MTITASALALIPGYVQHSEAQERIRAEVTANRMIKYASPLSVEDLVECALSGDAFPRDIQGHNEAIRLKKLNTVVRNRMLNEALKQLQSRKQKLIVENAGEAFTYVRGELAKLTREVRSTNRVLGNNIRTADQAVAANNPRILDAWQKAAALMARYGEIRDAQRALTLPALGRDDAHKMINAVGLIRNSLEQSNYWLEVRQRVTSHRAEDVHKGVQSYDAWLRAGGVAPPKPEGSWNYLVWLASKAEPWVPTAHEVATAYQAAKTAVSPVEVRSLATQEDARDLYFEIIETKPLIPYTRSPRSSKTEPFTKSNSPRRIDRSSIIEAAARAMGL